MDGICFVSFVKGGERRLTACWEYHQVSEAASLPNYTYQHQTYMDIDTSSPCDIPVYYYYSQQRQGPFQVRKETNWTDQTKHGTRFVMQLSSNPRTTSSWNLDTSNLAFSLKSSSQSEVIHRCFVLFFAWALGILPACRHACRNVNETSLLAWRDNWSTQKPHSQSILWEVNPCSKLLEGRQIEVNHDALQK